MKIDEAIKRNIDIQIEFLPLPSRDWQAVQLGIEALKAQKTYRRLGFIRQDQLLPGETKEDYEENRPNRNNEAM